MGFGSNTKSRMGMEETSGAVFEFPTKVPRLINIVKIDCGYWHSMALDASGQAWSAGYGNYGELGRMKEQTNSDTFGEVVQSVPFRDISCGFHFTFFVGYDDG